MRWLIYVYLHESLFLFMVNVRFSMPYMHAILGDRTLSLIHGLSQGGSKNQLSVGAHNSGPGFFMPQMWWDQMTRFTKNVGGLDTSYFLWGEKPLFQ